MELKLGIMTNKELAEWFGITEASLKNSKKKKLEELKLFAEFEEVKGKVKINKILEAVYNKQQGKTLRKVVEKIDSVWSEDGLDSCQRVGEKICELLDEEGLVRKPDTIVAYTRKGRNELYGKPFLADGKIGRCIYIWCKRNPNTGEYSLLTKEEEKIKQDLQTKYFGDATEKQILVKGMVEAGEINKEEAWGVLEEMTNMGTGNFFAFLQEIQKILGCQVIRGTLVERNALVLEKGEEKYGI
jgi:hypothetical protein